MSSPPAVSSYPGYFHASIDELIKSFSQKEHKENAEQIPYPGYFHASSENLKKLGKINEEESVEDEGSQHPRYPGHFHDAKEELEKIAFQAAESQVDPFPSIGNTSYALETTIEKVKSLSAALNIKNSVPKMIALASFSAAIIGPLMGADLKTDLLAATFFVIGAYLYSKNKSKII